MARFDLIFKEIIHTINEDYAGCKDKESLNKASFYVGAIGQAYKDKRLDDVLFLKYVNQYLSVMQDSNLNLTLTDNESYQNYSLGFKTRRIGDTLIVSEVSDETSLSVGDEILEINNVIPSTHRKRVQMNFFGSDISYNENWDLFLKMAQNILVRHTNGKVETVNLKQYPIKDCLPEYGLTHDGNISILKTTALDDGLNSLLPNLSGDKLIIDLRQCTSGDYDTIINLLSYLIKENVPLNQLMNHEVYEINYTEKNVKRKLTELKAYYEINQLPELMDYIKEYEAMSGKGLVKEQDEFFEADELVEKQGDFKKVVLIIDTYTANEAEIFVEYAKALPNVMVIGRETSGKYAYEDQIFVGFEGGFILEYPMAKRLSANGRIQPDLEVPFTKEECFEDLLLKKAKEVL